MTAGYPGTFPAGYTTGYLSIGAVQLYNASAKGYPGIFAGGYTQGYLTVGAVQKQAVNQWINTFSDSVTAGDSFSGSQSATTPLSESVTSSDSFANIAGYHNTLSDSTTGSDSITSSLAGVDSLNDTVTGSDSMGAAMATSETFSDGATASDSVIGGIGYTNTFSDGVTSSDTQGGSQQGNASISDSITGADSIVGGIGYNNTFSDSVTAADSFTATISPTPNINLYGTLNFGYFYPNPNLIDTALDFGLIVGDDNIVRVNLNNSMTAAEITPISATVSIYAPNTTVNPILTPAAIILSGAFQFTLPNADFDSLPAGEYPWIAEVETQDGTQHIVNCGDQNLTTGTITLVQRP